VSERWSGRNEGARQARDTEAALSEGQSVVVDDTPGRDGRPVLELAPQEGVLTLPDLSAGTYSLRVATRAAFEAPAVDFSVADTGDATDVTLDLRDGALFRQRATVDGEQVQVTRLVRESWEGTGASLRVDARVIWLPPGRYQAHLYHLGEEPAAVAHAFQVSGGEVVDLSQDLPGSSLTVRIPAATKPREGGRIRMRAFRVRGEPFAPAEPCEGGQSSQDRRSRRFPALPGTYRVHVEVDDRAGLVDCEVVGHTTARVPVQRGGRMEVRFQTRPPWPAVLRAVLESGPELAPRLAAFGFWAATSTPNQLHGVWPPGEYRARFTVSDLGTREVAFRVQPGKTTSITVPLEAPAPTGR